MNKRVRQQITNYHDMGIESREKSLISYFSRPFASTLLACEKQMIDKALECVFGFHIVQMSSVTRSSLIDQCSIASKSIIGFNIDDENACSVYANECYLPFPTDSVDAIVLHHMFEFSGSSHDLLKEVRRIVRPGGDILIIGFNPYSASGLRAFLGRLSRHVFWNQSLLSVSRLSDWLSLLDISVKNTEYAHFKLLLNRRFYRQLFDRLDELLRIHGLSLGAATYLLHAKNEYVPLTPIKLNRLRPSNGFLVGAKGGLCSDTVKRNRCE